MTVTIQEQVRDFIVESFYVSDPKELSYEISLIDSGIVDSTGMMDIILFLESTYGISIEDEETVPENLETIDRIAAFMARKQSGVAG